MGCGLSFQDVTIVETPQIVPAPQDAKCCARLLGRRLQIQDVDLYMAGYMNILFEDNDIIVINKPAGIATESASIGAKDIKTELLKYLKSKGEKPEIYVVHRLDQPVSGLMVFAKTQKAASGLSAETSEFAKDYEAMVYGTKLEPENTLVDYLKKDSRTNLSSVTDASEKGAKRAELTYEVIKEREETTLVKVHLKTGRHHQIRVQFAHLGYPLIGDRKYGSKKSVDYTLSRNINRIALCATHIKFKHPINSKILEYSIENDFE